MEGKLYDFIKIFSGEVSVETEKNGIDKIIIPIIQRDYAQGREYHEVNRIRERFLDALYDAVTKKEIVLDFVYGCVDDNGVLTPLDGQQRLTTLFLLHWYGAKKAKIDKEEYEFLYNFSYETRYSARDFCRMLVEKYQPSFTKTISEEIIDQHWFPLDWQKDSTIKSMLVVIDAINEKFKTVDNLWDRLNEGAISFYFLPISDMGLTDELYIKMNSRGKPLTTFEHFKAELEKELKLIDEKMAKRIIGKIDIEWSDLLWQYRGDNNIIDDEFLCYFRFICDVICYENGGSTQNKSNDEFELISEYFSKKSEHVESNISLMESFFDCWKTIESEYETIKDFFEEFITNGEHEIGKVKIDSIYDIDIFNDCLTNNVSADSRNRPFTLNKIILLFAIVTYLVNRDKISKSDFSQRLRIINNLTRNSSNEISDSENRSSGNRMPAIIAQTKEIMVDGKISDDVGASFNEFQLNEEREKMQWIKDNGHLKDELYKLEDYKLLYGQISIVGLENHEIFSRFIELFQCDWDLIDCALMSIGNYIQRERNSWRFQSGSKEIASAWEALFHKSSNVGFEESKRVLNELLSSDVSKEMLERRVNDFLADSESNKQYGFRYYYIKYPEFRPGSYGKYWWENEENREKSQYEVRVMTTKRNVSEYTYQPFLKAINKKEVEPYGKRIISNGKALLCTNNAYVVKSVQSDEVLCNVEIEQKNGVDIEDRILKMRSVYDNIMN